jgi:hypothetical protein
MWHFLIKPKVKEVEFVATFRFAIVVTLVPMWILVVSLLLATLFGFLMGFYYVIIIIVLAILAVKL